jgi:hypothetical protein
MPHELMFQRAGAPPIRRRVTPLRDQTVDVRFQADEGFVIPTERNR